MEGVARFFSTGGRVSVTRFALVPPAATAVIQAAAGALDWTRGYPFNAALGLIVGAAFAKILAEAARRLHDTGVGARTGAAVALGLGVFVVLLLSAVDGLPPRLVTAAFYGVPLVALLPLLRPGARGANAHGPPPSMLTPSNSATGRPSWRTASLPIALTALGLGCGVFYVWLSQGIRRNNEAMQREMERRGREAGGEAALDAMGTVDQ